MRRKTLALLLAAALTVTSIEGTVLVSGADFITEGTEEAPVDLGEADPQSETDTTFETETDISEDGGTDIFTDQEEESGSEEIEFTEDESDEPSDEIEVFAEPEDGADGEEETEFTDENADESGIGELTSEDEAAEEELTRVEAEKTTTVPVKEKVMAVSFTPEETGRYHLEFDTSVNCYIYEKESTTPINSRQWDGYNVYEELKEGTTYSIYAYLKIDITETQITISKAAKAVKLEILSSDIECIAGVDTVGNMNLQTKVTYDDGTSKIAGNGEKLDGYYLEYLAVNAAGEGYSTYTRLSAGKWKCVPRLNKGYGAIETVADCKEITITATMPEVDTLEPVAAGKTVTVEAGKKTFYKFTPEESATYRITYTGRQYVYFYDIQATGLSCRGDSASLSQGKDYLILVNCPYSTEFTVTKEENSSGGDQTNEYPIEVGGTVSVDLENTKGDYVFNFSPSATGYYKIWVEGDIYGYVYLKEGDKVLDDDSMQGNIKLLEKLEAGKNYTCEIQVYGYNDNIFKVHLDKVTHKNIKNMELQLKDGIKDGDMTVLSDLFDFYNVVFTYEDDSSSIIKAYDDCKNDEYSGKDDYGNSWSATVDYAGNDLEKETVTGTVKIVYDDPENESGLSVDYIKKIQVKGIKGLDTLNESGVSPFKNSVTDQWFVLTNMETARYVLNVEAEKGERLPKYELYRYIVNGNSIITNYERISFTDRDDESYGYIDLINGNSYLVHIYRESAEYANDVVLKTFKEKTISSATIKKAPDQTTVYDLGRNTSASLEGLVLTVYYTDGSSETVAYGEKDSSGHFIESGSGYWRRPNSYRVAATIGDCTVNVDFSAAELPGMLPELKTGEEVKLPASDQMIIPLRFTAPKSGYYGVNVVAGSIEKVINEKTQVALKNANDYGSENQNLYFEKDETYLIYIYTEKKDVSVSVWEGACRWIEVKNTYVEATCTEAASYKAECTVHNHSCIIEEEPAYGHIYGSWKNMKEATCTEAASKERTCLRCGHVEKKEVAPAKGHSFGSWKTTKEATVLNNGQKERTCSVCKKKETASIAKLKATVQLNVSGTLPLKVKQTFQVKVTTGKGDKVVSWSSSNKKAASVDKNGKVKGLKAGKTATITVKLASGLKKSFKVKIQKANVATKSIKVLNASTGKKMAAKATLKHNATLKLQTTVSPVTSKEKVTYSSSNKKIATVSSKGVIKAKKKGKVTITVKSGKKSYKIKVTVK